MVGSPAGELVSRLFLDSADNVSVHFSAISAKTSPVPGNSPRSVPTELAGTTNSLGR